MTEDEIAEWKKKIDKMTRLDCASAIRFHPIGQDIFDSRNGLYEYFMGHFKSLGGWSPEISKQLGH